jgi:hypothetical protein
MTEGVNSIMIYYKNVYPQYNNIIIKKEKKILQFKIILPLQ